MARLRAFLKLLPLFRKASSDIKVVGWYQSSVVWTNIIYLISGGFLFIFGSELLPPEQVTPLASNIASMASAAIGIAGALGIVQRASTSVQIGKKTITAQAEQGEEDTFEDVSVALERATDSESNSDYDDEDSDARFL